MGMSGGCSWCTGHGSGTTHFRFLFLPTVYYIDLPSITECCMYFSIVDN
jgi:hypothetical protein